MPYALNSMQKKAWEISEKSKEERTRVQALSLAKECGKDNSNISLVEQYLAK